MAGMIVGKFVSADLDLSGAVSFLPLKTKAGREYAYKRFDLPVSSPTEILSIQKPIIDIRKRLRKDANLESELDTIFQELETSELAVNEITHFQEVDKRITETTDQIYWKSNSYGGFLNTWGLVLEMILLWKTILSPGFALLTPLLVVVLPYILLHTIFHIDIPVQEYLKLLQKMVLSNVPKMPFAKESSGLGDITKYAYLAMSVGVFLSNIWNQVQAALHLRTVAADVRDRGTQLLNYVHACKKLATLLNSNEGLACSEEVQFTEETTALGAYGMMLNESRALARLRAWVAEIDLQVACAKLKGICFPRPLKRDTFHLSIKGLYHPGVPAGKRILNDFELDSKPHILLTGPNRGGKSTMLKSVGLSIMTAQTWGIAWAKSMDFVPVAHFETALSPADTLGRLSLFEAEIEFAKQILAMANQANADREHTPSFVLMDEIFHSTNAHDGAEASLIFLNQLYDMSNGKTGSLISTHYRELPTKLSDRILTFCMEAFDKNERLEYTYRCVPGVSSLSSVREILKERGLLK